MAELTDEDVKTILNLFEESDFDYLQFEAGDLKLTASKHGFVPSTAPAPIVPQPAPLTEQPSAREPSEPAKQTVKETTVEKGLLPVLSPIVGTFYAAPDQQSPPFVTLGDRVEEGSTIGLIEVMKVFASISAVVSGEIVEIAVANAQLVEIDQVLFYIRPDNPDT